MMQGRDLLNAYLNGEDLTPQQGEALSAWICSSDENSRHAAVLMHLNQSVAEAVRSRSAATLMSDDADPHWVNFFGEDDADQAQAKPIADELPPIHLDATALTKEKYLSALTYVLKHTFTPKRVAILATAAALLLGMVLAITLTTGPASQPYTTNTPENKPAASTQSTPRGSTPVTTPVATLTNTHNAQWGRPASAGTDAGTEHPLKTGTPLHPNTRLTLTQGFAEITTARGTVAIIQAPATIELLNQNALRLHTGKLVGICETESSKGFLVRTPNMDITDLGTRFGVQVKQDAGTQIHVIEGAVSVARVDNRGLASSGIRLSAGDAWRCLSDGDLTQINFDFNQFVYDMPRQGSPPRIEGDLAIYAEAVPADLTQGISARRELQIYREQTGLILEQDLHTNLVVTPDPNHHQADPTATIPAGQAVDVFLLHLDTGKSEEFVGRYVIHFDRPVLGVIVSESQLIETDRLLGVPDVLYPPETSSYQEFAKRNPSARRGFERPANDNPDFALVDGSTLTVTMSTSKYMDQVRVIVQSQTPQQDSQRTGDFPPTN